MTSLKASATPLLPNDTTTPNCTTRTHARTHTCAHAHARTRTRTITHAHARTRTPVCPRAGFQTTYTSMSTDGRSAMVRSGILPSTTPEVTACLGCGHIRDLGSGTLGGSPSLKPKTLHRNSRNQSLPFNDQACKDGSSLRHRAGDGALSATASVMHLSKRS